MFEFDAAMRILIENIDSSLSILQGELELRTSNSYAMSKAVELKLFRYLPTSAQDKFVLAPCIHVLSSRIHKNLVDAESINETTLN